MCGINGILRLDADAPPVDREELLRTRDAMTSRGPDGSGLWISPREDVGFGHRRLAIIDLSDAGAQPMVSADGRYVIVFNGEIYNYRDLRADLQRQGAVFKSHSDTEVLLALFGRYGADMLPRLRGMYAFAIWDEQDRRLFMARDPFGIKPLYYSLEKGVLRFASQVKALEASRTIPLDVDSAGLCGFLLWGSVPEPFTLRQSIRALPAGHWIEVADGRLASPKAHFHLGNRAETSSPDVVAALEDSVKHHLVSDVPVGIFLSSGLDSALLTALMRRHVTEPPLTFTLAFNEFLGTSLDEAPGAAVVARTLGCRHVERGISAKDLEDLWPRALEAMDQPSIDGFNVFIVSHYAKEAGLKVVLSGLGGDELFGSYPSFKDVPRWRRWSRAGNRVPGLAWAWRRLGRKLASRPKLAGFLRHGASLPGAYFLRRGLFLPEELPRLLEGSVVRDGSTYDPKADAGKMLRPGIVDEWIAVQVMESTQYLRNQLLRDADWASMAHSLELRVPLVDPVLYRSFSSALFEPVRSEGKGAMIRQAAPELPPQVFERAKSGFMVPWAGSPRPSASGAGRWGHQARLLGLEVLKAFGVELADRPGKRSRSGGTLFLLPEAFRGDGGIQTYNRAQVQAVLRSGSAEPLSALVLNDNPAEVRQPEWRSIRARGFGRRHARFAAASLLTAARQQPQRTIIAHRNFLPLAPLVAMAAPGRQRWLLTYGIEAQRPLHLLERGLLRWIDRVFAISPQTAKAFKVAGYRGSVDLWPCSLPFSWTLPEPRPPRFESPVRLLSVSRLAPPERYKGIDVTISAVGLLRSRGHAVVFDVVGEGRDLERLQALCREGDVEDSVHFHGRVTTDRLRDLYALSDIFVLPSGAEGFGIVYLEALAFAKPVIAADAGGAPFVVRPGASGILVPYGDAEGLARSIEALIQDPGAARSLGSRGRAFLERNFSFEHMVRRTRNLFGEAATPSYDVEVATQATSRERHDQSIGPV